MPNRSRTAATAWHASCQPSISPSASRSRAGSEYVPCPPGQLVRSPSRADYGNACYICRVSLDFEPSHWDHFQPISKGGDHSLANLRPACKSCNRRKQARWPFTPAMARAIRETKSSQSAGLRLHKRRAAESRYRPTAAIARTDFAAADSPFGSVVFRRNRPACTASCKCWRPIQKRHSRCFRTGWALSFGGPGRCRRSAWSRGFGSPWPPQATAPVAQRRPRGGRWSGRRCTMSSRATTRVRGVSGSLVGQPVRGVAALAGSSAAAGCVSACGKVGGEVTLGFGEQVKGSYQGQHQSP